jgi:predicted O-methyltransferase YrrM
VQTVVPIPKRLVDGLTLATTGRLQGVLDVATLVTLPAGVLGLCADPAAIPAGPEHTVALVAPTPGAPQFALAMMGAPADTVQDVLAEIAQAHTQAAPTDPVAPEVGRVLYLLTRARRSKRALELGTSAGAAALWLAAALTETGGRLVTVERDSAKRTLAARHLRTAGLDSRVDLRLGEAARLMDRLPSPLDLVLLDETPEDREADFGLLLGHLAPGALVISHGGFTNPTPHTRFNALLRSHPRVRLVLALAVGDGLTLAVMTG